MRIAILHLLESDATTETALAVTRAGMLPVSFLWQKVAEPLADFDGFIIQNGLVSAGDPVLAILKEQSHLGKPILGMGQGAQILVESGLVPGLENHKVGVQVLAADPDESFVGIRLSDEYQYNAFTRNLSAKKILPMPVMSQYRFMIPPGLLMVMQVQGLNVFQYCDASGSIQASTNAADNIAAVSNKAGNVMAMLAHPASSLAGDVIFQSMRDYIKKGYVERVAPLHYHPRREGLD